MHTLLIDTSTDLGLLALSRKGQVIGQIALCEGYRNSTLLMPSLRRLLLECGVEVHDLTAVAVCVGPGSYTGLRVGVAVAKGLAFARNIPLIGICSLKAYLPPCDGTFAALIDAKISGAYLIIGEKNGADITYLTNEEVLALEFLDEKLLSVPQLVTPSPFQDRVAPYLSSSKDWSLSSPSAEHLANIAHEHFLKGEFCLDQNLTLLYLRKTQAELERE